MADNVKVRLLQPDGSYVLPPLKPGMPIHRSQVEFIALASDDTRFLKRERKALSNYPRVKVASSPFTT